MQAYLFLLQHLASLDGELELHLCASPIVWHHTVMRTTVDVVTALMMQKSGW